MNKNHIVFHGSVNSTFLSAAAHAGGGVHEAGLQLVAQTQAHGRTQRDTVDGVRRDGHFHLQLLAQVLRQAVVTYPKRTVSWVEFKKLIPAETQSPFPALTQLEIYGKITN